MKKLWGGASILGAACLWWLWQPTLPEKGFLYVVDGGDGIRRVQGIFRSSPVEMTQLRVVTESDRQFYSWAAITPLNAVEGERTGVCLFDDDGNFSGFLRLSGDTACSVTSVAKEGGALVVTVSQGETREALSFAVTEADVWIDGASERGM